MAVNDNNKMQWCSAKSGTMKKLSNLNTLKTLIVHIAPSLWSLYNYIC